MTKFHCVSTKCPLVHHDSNKSAGWNAHTTVTLVTIDPDSANIMCYRDFLARFHTNHSRRHCNNVNKFVKFIFTKIRDLTKIGSICHSFFEVCQDLLPCHEYPLTVSHSCSVFCCHSYHLPQIRQAILWLLPQLHLHFLHSNQHRSSLPSFLLQVHRQP